MPNLSENSIEALKDLRQLHTKFGAVQSGISEISALLSQAHHFVEELDYRLRSTKNFGGSTHFDALLSLEDNLDGLLAKKLIPLLAEVSKFTQSQLPKQVEHLKSSLTTVVNTPVPKPSKALQNLPLSVPITLPIPLSSKIDYDPDASI